MKSLSVDLDPAKTDHSVCDVIVVGSGIAGLTTALELSKNHEVTLVTKGEIRQTTTWLAQGGLAATVSKKDSPLYHLKDTVIAGDELCDIKAVEVLVNEGPGYVNDLIKLGTRFDVSGKRFSLGREGGHSHRRILHFKDATGSEIQDSLVRASNSYASIDIREHAFAVDLLRKSSKTIGLLVLDMQKGALKSLLARHVVIASGGACQIYSATTNPEIATGDGIAMAYRAGAELMDMEFVQFHPTVFFKEGKASFLITEALRGEGAYLVNAQGERIMEGVHPLKELAPRDIVSRTIFKSMKKPGKQVYLDARHIPPNRIARRFPAVSEFLTGNGLDLRSDLIPIAPAAHYFIGGIRTDIDGRTNLAGVYACGEAAATGVHGANRLASNSLLEGLVFARRIAVQIDKELKKTNKRKTRTELVEEYLDMGSGKSVSQSTLPPEKATKIREELGQITWDHISVFRRKEGLDTALAAIKKLGHALERKTSLDPKILELRNLLTIARLVGTSALIRTESRGVHFRADHSKRNDRKWKVHLSVIKEQHYLRRDDELIEYEHEDI